MAVLLPGTDGEAALYRRKSVSGAPSVIHPKQYL